MSTVNDFLKAMAEFLDEMDKEEPFMEEQENDQV